MNKMMNRVFCNENWENQSLNDKVVLCGWYHRYRNPDNTINPAFDMFSGKILDVKDKRESAIAYFFQQLNGELCKDITICVVPSHTQSNSNTSGVAEIARRLAEDGRVDKVDFLIRTRTIPKLSHGGNRNIQVHLDSIEANPTMSVSGDVVLIVDDVTTSGTSLEACKEILLKCGARRVAMLALGQAI